MADKKKVKDKPSPSMLGTGGAYSAAEKMIKRQRKMCEMMGGAYDRKSGKCN